MPKTAQLDDDPLWYKDAVIYEVHVRAFFDSSGDGMGDFAGLHQKLDYLQDLGVTTIWVLPFCPSPWRDDGYDISDYANVHPAYGTLRDFQNFLREAHARGLRVITELVLNHTSDQHVWFQRSRRGAPGSRWRNFYVWSDSPERYSDARIIFKDFETSNWTWDPVAKAYFWHRFYSHQPDLNFDNPEVRAAMLNAMDFWFDMGVDGLRLDAVPYLYEREGTNCENLPETHAFLKDLRSHIDARYHGRMLLAEANQWPEDAITYFGAADECHMAFHFPLMPRLFMAIRMEDRYPVTEIMQLTPPIPDACQWALFLRNHDELTLEMVTDEERDYMYRLYAQDGHMRINLGIRRRLAPLLENDRRRIELMNALLLSLPGTPVIYYGDEIGMGDNIYLGDRNGVRTPMQWSGDRNAGFSRTNPQKLYLPVNIDPEYHFEALNVETQQNNPHSLLWWMKRLLAQRKQLRAMGRGSLDFLYPENRHILAFVRRHEEERVLVVANLSRFAQSTELDLAQYTGLVPMELFGRTEFPAIAGRPYFLSLGPHAFYWFALQSKEARQETLRIRTGEPPTIAVPSLERVFSGSARAGLNRMLPYFLRGRRWFRGENRTIRVAEIHEAVPFPKSKSYLLLIRVEYSEGEPEFYTLPLSVKVGAGEDFEWVLARLQAADGTTGVLYSALRNREFADELFTAILRRRRFAGERGEILAAHTRAFPAVWGDDRPTLEPTLSKVEQDNTTLFYGDRFALKFLRRVDEGPHPEREISALLTQAGVPNAAPLAGTVEYRTAGGEPITVALLHGFVKHGTETWQYTLDHLGLYYEHALARGQPPGADAEAGEPEKELAQELIGSYLQVVRLLGKRTGELHAALASRSDDPLFAPEPFTDFYRHGLYHGMLARLGRTADLVRSSFEKLPEEVRADAQAVLERQPAIRDKLRYLRNQRINAARIRIHGDYHLAQALYTGKDFVMIDFEGDLSRPQSERRIKRSPLEDVAGMLDSFYHASHGVLFGETPGVIPKPETLNALEAWAKFWYRSVRAEFLDAYLATPGVSALLPQNPEQLRTLLGIFLLDFALRKLTYALTNAPDRIRVPAHAILELVAAS
ncbi:MAG TPA: maltose alpha-D-glucosyltransferase [Bryobacteraceae bacterium]|jgi:maltose alpha-D-glucosyltransferase/alpha-amylase|nr:maltose alpha-D-glucosyltransferase [Bryobacteraceae bacterium]